MNTKEIGIQAIKDEAEALLDLIPKMDDQFEKAVELMLNCKGFSSIRSTCIMATWA